jgi:ribosomal protein S18 acetylase RimI-like enzyme
VTPNPALHLLDRTRPNPSLHFRLADPADVTTLYDIRQAAIRQLSLTHLSECEAVDWAELGGIPRVEQAIAKDEVWVATLGRQVVGWVHRAANSIEGLYVSPPAARQGVGTALVRVAESHIAQRGHALVVLESSLNAMGFYLRLGYAPAGTQWSSTAVSMSKHLEAAQSMPLTSTMTSPAYAGHIRP